MISPYIQNQIDDFHAEVTLTGYSEMKPGLEDRSCEQQLYRIIFMDKGQAGITIAETEHRAEAGQMFLVPAGVPFRINVAGSALCGCYYCHFRSEKWELPIIDTVDFPLMVTVGSIKTVRQLFHKMMLVHNGCSVTRKLKLRSALLELFALYVDQSVSRLSPVLPADVAWDEVLSYIEQHLSDNITVEDLAKVACLHPNYFISLFKTVMGCSPIQYVTKRRILSAKQMLVDTELSVMQIAERVGMLNHYLSRQFKRIIGVTPMQYRKYAQLGAEHLATETGHPL